MTRTPEIRRRTRSAGRAVQTQIRRRAGHLLALGLSAGFLAFVLLVPLDVWAAQQGGLRWRLYCYLADHRGWHAPLGALIRSLSACARGDLGAALDTFFIGPLLFAYLGFQVPYHLWGALRHPRLLPRGLRRVQVVLTVLVVGAIVTDWLLLVGRRLA